MAQNYFLYVRKSTDTEERQVKSIEDQLAELKTFAAKENLRIKEIFQEAMTAKQPGRPVFNEMLDRIEQGEAQGIIAWHPDRLARNSVDGGRIIYLVDTNSIHSLKFPTFWFENTPQGKFMLNISFGQSKYYIDNLSENVRRGLRQKVRRGEWPSGFTPVGYINDKNARVLKIDPVKGPLVKKLFETYATGQYTLVDLKKVSFAWGLISRTGKPWVKSELQRTLKNTFYYGLMKYKGEYHQGIHEPLITKELYDKVQEVIIRKGKPFKYKKKYFPLLGLATCPQCGCAITATVKKGHNYYHCTKRRGPCPERYLREERYAQHINRAISQMALSDLEYDYYKRRLEKEKTDIEQPLLLQKSRITGQIKEIESKLNSLLDLHLDSGIDKDQFISKKKNLLNDKKDLEETLTKLELQGPGHWLEPCRKFLETARSASELAESEDLEQKCKFLKKIGWNFYLGGRQLTFEYKSPWTLLGGNSFNSKSLGLLLDPNFSSTEAAQAAKIFEKPGPFTKMRYFRYGHRTLQ